MDNQYPNILFRSDKNIFYARVPYTDKLTGNKKRKTIYGTNVKTVQQKIDEFQKELSNLYGDERNQTLSQLIKKEADTDLALNNIKESTYTRRLDTLKIIEKHKISKLKIKDINDKIIKSFLIFIVNYGYSNSSIKKAYSLLKQTLTNAYNRGVINENLFLKYNIKLPKSNKKEKEIIPLNENEQKAFTEAAEKYKPKFEDMFNKNLQPLIELYSGMRMGEVNALRLCDIDLENKKIFVNGTIERGPKGIPFRSSQTKTNSGMRKIPINSKLEKYIRLALDNYIPNSEELIFFDKNNNRPFTTQSVNKVIETICKKANIRVISSHTLRHTYATRLVEYRVPIKIIQNLMGHKDIKITMNVYTSVLDDYENSAMTIINEKFSKM